MKTKKEQILNSALTLFGTHGFDATSTNKVAKAAGVSEGLIFRHFQSKKGLLNAVMASGVERAEQSYNEILSLKKPKDVLRGIIELPFSIEKKEYSYWKLLYSLKWQAGEYEDNSSAQLKKGLNKVFKDLKYKDPKAETEILLSIMDGMAMTILLRNPRNKKAILEVLLKKYKL